MNVIHVHKSESLIRLRFIPSNFAKEPVRCPFSPLFLPKFGFELMFEQERENRELAM